MSCNTKLNDGSYCDSCADMLEEYGRSNQHPATPTIVQKVFIKDYGHESVKRIEEIKRRVILPYDVNGGYVVGRRGENGVIQEREPNY